MLRKKNEKKDKKKDDLQEKKTSPMVKPQHNLTKNHFSIIFLIKIFIKKLNS
ncbi:hypothetical protein SAMN04487910_3304 [Aquimarina amphilecti]|uniref:Uncharacterized protein n=1 Tax=Aquimarina amphilecti TaxID=1038014 RepID=A0A1H7T688_AQUAM|nr:hypothetical protein SAMN04487910_3304 [Aquimarina amphilecti]